MRPSPALSRALLVSLAVHALLLAGVVVLPEVRMRPDAAGPALSAVLTKTEARAAAAVDRPPVREVDRPRTAPVAVKSPVTPALVSASTEPARIAPPPSTPPPLATAPNIVPATPGRATMAGTSSPAEVDRREAVDPQIEYRRAEYILALRSQARRFKRYPALARERGWEGTVRIEIRIYPQRAQPEAVLLRESGYRVLDEQALDMMRQAVARTEVPEVLQRQGARIAVPVEFALSELDQ